MKDNRIAAFSFQCATLLLVLWWANTPISAQKQGPALVDSLRALALTLPEDSNKVIQLNDYAYELLDFDQEAGLQFATEALNLAEKLRWPWGVAYAKQILGRVHWRWRNFPEALKNHFEALQTMQALDDKPNIAMLQLFIGQDYANSGDYPESLKHLSTSLASFEALEDKDNQAVLHGVLAWVFGNMGKEDETLHHEYAALRIFEETGDRYGMAIAYSNLATLQEEQGNFEEALKVYRQSQAIYKEFGDTENFILTHHNIGRCYASLGKYPEALNKHQLALEEAKKIKNEDFMAEAYANIGEVYQRLHNDAGALKHYLLAADLFAKSDNRQRLAELFTGIANHYTRLKDFASAKTYFDKAFALNTEMQSLPNMNQYFYGRMKLDSALGDWQNAFEHHKRYVSTRDSLYNEENTRKVVQTRMQYEFDKKQSAYKREQEQAHAIVMGELQRQKRFRNGLMAAFAVVILYAGVFFFQRNKIRREKRRSDELLLNILPAEVAEELKAKGSAEAKLMDEVTVLFSDFKGFTTLSETQTPKELVAEINACFSAFDHIMQRNGVEKIKTVGDGYLAAGGLPSPTTDHATKVLKAALEMQAFMRERQTQREAEGRFFFEARIGVHTGPVVAGIVGVKKFAYDIWGDTVNTAQRMESGGEVGKVNISGSTFQLVKGQFQCTHRGKRKTKGKGKVDMYFVEGEGSPSENP